MRLRYCLRTGWPLFLSLSLAVGTAARILSLLGLLSLGTSTLWPLVTMSCCLCVHGMLIRHCLSGDGIASMPRHPNLLCHGLAFTLARYTVFPEKPLHEPLVVHSMSEPQPVYQDLLNVSTVPARVI